MSLPTEFDRTGVTYYAVAPDGYTYTSEQTAQYGTRKYTTLAACAAALPYTPTTPFVVNILGSWSSALGTSTWSGPTFTATNYLIIRCIGDARHGGVYSSTAARVSVTSGYGLQIYTAYTTVEGLQFIAGTPTADIYMVGIYSSSSCVLDSCLIKGPGGTPANYMWGVEGGATGGTIKNCVIYDWTSSIGGGVGIAPEYSANHYNNTIRNCDYGFYSYASDGVATNNVVQDCGTSCYYGTSSFTGSNNVADDSTSPGTAKINGEVTFEDETAGNFQLTSGDTVARGAGVTLAAVDDDITGTTRTIHSCGAFEGSSGGGGNSVTETESPADPTSTQDVTQPNVVASTESLDRATETSTASQANTATSSESPSAPSEAASVTQPAVVVSTELPEKAVEISTVLVGNTIESNESPSLATELESATQPVFVVSTEVAMAPFEAETALPGAIVSNIELPSAAVESASVTQRVEVVSLESSASPTNLESVLFGNTISTNESPSAVSELETTTQPVIVISIELASAPSAVSTATQGTAVLSVETPTVPLTSSAVVEYWTVTSFEAASGVTESSTATEIWSVSSTETSIAPTSIQTIEQFWLASSSEIPANPSESESVDWAYLVTSSERSGVSELESVQQPFSVISIETPNGAIELSRAYRQSQVLGGSTLTLMVDRRSISLTFIDRHSAKLFFETSNGISLALTNSQGN